MLLGEANCGLTKGEVAHRGNKEGDGINRAKPFAIHPHQVGAVQVKAVKMLDQRLLILGNSVGWQDVRIGLEVVMARPDEQGNWSKSAFGRSRNW